jgi:hypothetical protein
MLVVSLLGNLCSDKDLTGNDVFCYFCYGM